MESWCRRLASLMGLGGLEVKPWKIHFFSMVYAGTEAIAGPCEDTVRLWLETHKALMNRLVHQKPFLGLTWAKRNDPLLRSVESELAELESRAEYLRGLIRSEKDTLETFESELKSRRDSMSEEDREICDLLLGPDAP